MGTQDEDRDRQEAEGYSDPTAPPPLEEPSGGAEATQPIGSSTQPFAVPSAEHPESHDAPAPPAYDHPTYSQPSYTTPTYGLPSAPPPSAAPTGPPAPSGPGSVTGAGYPSGPPSAPAAGTPYPSGPPVAGPAGQPYPPPPSGPGAPPPPAPGFPAPYATPPGGYAAPPSNTSAIVLTVVSGLMVISCCGVLEIPALVLGILGITRQRTDPAGAASITRKGWIAFGVGIAVTVVAAVLWFSFAWTTTSTADFSTGGI